MDERMINIKYDIAMKDIPNDVSDKKYIIDNLADNIFYFHEERVSVRNMSVPSPYFKKLMFKKVGKNLFDKMVELKYLYDEFTLQLEDIVRQDIKENGA
jgi:hypothetical protein